MFRILLFVSFMVSGIFSAQNLHPVYLEIIPLYKGKPIIISEENPVITDVETSLEISKLKFYLSHFEFYSDDKLAFSEKNSYHLMDGSDEKSMKITFSFPENIKFNTIKFYLGIDKKTNSEGIRGGDLDPAKGMYWSWQTGYINFKLEGKSNLSSARNHEFSFHLGGYSDPYYTTQQITLAATSAEKVILYMDLDQFISKVNLAQQNNIMIPGKESVELSKIISTIFRTK
ncbi:MbnP family protein [uncultured Chryseobacterium sp.]|uniref:MbnP family protein n=1 Tax=uncultured Chryseobacterium sp. TaxID=259322 RepID=UPI0025882C5D|nr:MbnP family protein [uncultured Chryseobacterium sp.]